MKRALIPLPLGPPPRPHLARCAHRVTCTANFPTCEKRHCNDLLVQCRFRI